jgi:hypothetical protein
MKQIIDDFVNYVAPALKDAFVRGAKVAAYIVLSAALTAVVAYLESTGMDPATFAIINVALAAAREAIRSLNS